MSNLIDRDALIVEINGWIYDDDDYPKTDKQRGYNSGLRKAIRLCEKAPTVDAEPVRHERWIQPDRRKGYRCCSGCKNGGIWVDVPLPKFCGECGAKMDKEEENEV